jgi:septal ring factor EnvC (AmiA/AmiB activator)
MIIWLKAHKVALGLATGLLLLVGALWIASSMGSWQRERREDKREEKREQIKVEEQDLRRSADQDQARAVEREREIARLKTEADRLRAQIQRLRSARKKASTDYENRQSEIDSITDYSILRARNCADRAHLGYPCP